jgi:hypothetical protein
MTSTSFITGTGLKKCIPIILSGRLVNAPSLVMEMEEVFKARIISVSDRGLWPMGDAYHISPGRP